MIVALRLLALVLTLLAVPPLAAAAVPAALRDGIIADARAQVPAGLAFDRATALVRTGGGSVTRLDQVERWDGQRWKLVTRNGKPPTRSEREEAERLAAARPVPGYYRVADLVAAATETTTDADGRTVLRIPQLPPGTMLTESSDISSHLKADVTIATKGGQNFVEQVRITEREPFRMNMLIKVTNFELISDYKLDPGGKPRLARQSADSTGTMFGFPGGEKSEVAYTYR